MFGGNNNKLSAKNIVKYSLYTKIGVNKEILVERFKFQ